MPPFTRSMVVRREAAVPGSNPKPTTSNHTVSEGHKKRLRSQKCGNLKRRRSRSPQVDDGFVDSQHESIDTEKFDKLCDKCVIFTRWVSKRPAKLGWFMHKHIEQVSASVRSCDLCRMLDCLLNRYRCLRNDYYIFWQHCDGLKGEAKTAYYLTLIIGSKPTFVEPGLVTVWPPRVENVAVNTVLAVHTNQGLPEAGGTAKLSSRSPLPSEPCPEVYDQVKVWLQNCVRNHDECRRTMGNQVVDDDAGMAILPKRVIDVGRLGADYVRLLETSTTRGRYCALSHCWGAEKPMMTTIETLKSHLTDIPLQDLPKTFREAVEITRGIGIRYLWIDSLCIIQGDKKDWHEQAKHMAMIYGRAHLTIAASSAKDSTEGCFFGSRAQNLSIRLPFHEKDKVVGHFYLSLNKEHEKWDPYKQVLRSRAWALQEWSLSRRILHCTKGGLVWRCSSTYLIERDIKRRELHRDENWNDIMKTYSKCDLTNPSDRLIALRGMIDAIQQTRSDRNVFGIWAGDMPKSLLWSVGDRGKGMLGMKEVPSWSWVAKDGPKLMLPGISNWVVEDLTGKMNLVDDDARVISSEGFVVPCLATRIREFPDHSSHLLGHFRTYTKECDDRICTLRRKEKGTVSHVIGAALVDDDQTLQEKGILGLFYVYMVSGRRSLWKGFAKPHDEDSCMRCMFHYPKSEIFYWVLLLKTTCDKENRFQRIGIGIVWDEPKGSRQKFSIE